MKHYTLAIGLLFLLQACGPSLQSNGDRVMGITDGFVENQSPKQLEELIERIDKKMAMKALEKVNAEESSICAGRVEGYYVDNELVYTSSRIEHELKSYSTRDVYWSHGEILKIVYKEHLPDWEAHQEKYPPNIYGAKLEKMIYGDTLYEVTFGPKGRFHKRTAKGKLLSNRVDPGLLLRLVECAQSMKLQLAREKEHTSMAISYSFKGLEGFNDTLPFRNKYVLQVKVGDLDPQLLNCSMSATTSSGNKIVRTKPGIYTLTFTNGGTYRLYLSMTKIDGSQKHIDTKTLYILPPKGKG